MYIEWETKCEEGKLYIAADVNWFHLTVIVCVCFIGSWIIIIMLIKQRKPASHYNYETIIDS